METSAKEQASLQHINKQSLKPKKMKQLNNHSYQRIRFIAASTSLLRIFIAGLFILVSCKKELNPANENNELFALSKSNAKEKQASIIVHAGGSIQAAVNTAPAGSVIKIEPGTYSGSIVINKPGITLMGASQGKNGEVIIQNSGEQENGITVQENGDGFVLKNVTVRDFEENGVVLTGVDGFLLSHVNAINNGEYGLFPVFSKNGVIEYCIASGHSDTGIYIGQSSNVAINQNEAYNNVNGIEIENSSFVVADKNHSYNNVVGIMSVLLPGLVVKESFNIILTKNQVNDNNHINFAEQGELEAVIPSGSGILIVGSDNTLVLDNHVSGNKFVGVA